MGGPDVAHCIGPRTASTACLGDLERQLRRLRAFALVTYPFACVPFLFPYFRGHGLDEAGYGEVLTAYYLAMFVAEVPTGMLADRIGPRPMLVLGPSVLALGFLTLVCARDHVGFLVGEALLGLGHAVLSGPPSSALYDLLQRNGAQHRYLEEESRLQSRRLYGTGASFLLGGAMVRFGNAGGDAYASTIVVTLVLNLAASAIALTLPRATREASRRAPFWRAARVDLMSSPVRWLLAYWCLLFTLLRFPFHDYQPYLQATAPLEPCFAEPLFVGLLFALLNLVAAPLSRQLPWLVTRLGRRLLFWAMPLLLALSLVVMAGERAVATSRVLAWLGVGMFFVQQVPFGLHLPLVNEFLNHRIGSTARTTMLSVMSLAARLFYALVNLLLFRLQESRGIGSALGAAGIGGGLLAAIVLWLRPRGLLRGDRPLG